MPLVIQDKNWNMSSHSLSGSSSSAYVSVGFISLIRPVHTGSDSALTLPCHSFYKMLSEGRWILTMFSGEALDWEQNPRIPKGVLSAASPQATQRIMEILSFPAQCNNCSHLQTFKLLIFLSYHLRKHHLIIFQLSRVACELFFFNYFIIFLAV